MAVIKDEFSPIILDPQYNIEEGVVKFTWSAIDYVASELEVPREVTGFCFRYGISEKLEDIDPVMLSKGTYQVTPPKEGKYFYQLGAVDDAGNIGWSNVKNFTIAATSYEEGETIDLLNVPANGNIGNNGNYEDKFALELAYPGKYYIDGKFGVLKGSITIYNGKKKVASANIKKGELAFKEVLLTSGVKYDIVIKNSDKGKTASNYEFYIKGTEFFTQGDNSDDWEDMKINGDNSKMVDKKLGTLTHPGKLLVNWVGFGDKVDYKKIHLNNSAKLVFDIEGSDAAKFTIYELQQNKKGVYSLKSLQSTTLKKIKNTDDYTAETKPLFLKGGDYYICMDSTNATNGGNCNYTIEIDDDSSFFPKGDNSNDTWKQVQDSKAVTNFSGWVGFGDKADYFRFEVDKLDKIAFKLDDETEDALEDKEIKISCLNSKGKSVSLSAFGEDKLVSKKALTPGTYYLGVTCANEKKYDTSYNINLSTLV